MISSTDIANNLTVYNAASGEYSLKSDDNCGTYNGSNCSRLYYLELLHFPKRVTPKEHLEY